MFVDPRLPIAMSAALGVCLLTAGVLRWSRRRRMHLRLRALSIEWSKSQASVPASNMKWAATWPRSWIRSATHSASDSTCGAR